MYKIIIPLIILTLCTSQLTAHGLTPVSREVQVIAEVIAAEAANQGPEGLRAVAEVIRNRSLAWHKTPVEIVTQSGQFFGYTNPNKHRIYLGVKEITDKLSLDILTGDLRSNITKGALYFLLPGEKIRAWHGEKTVVIGAHDFYREVKK